MPAGWPAAVRAARARATTPRVREHGRRAGADRSATRRRSPTCARPWPTPTAPAADRPAALEALIEKRVAGPAPPLLHDLLADKATAARGPPRAGGVPARGHRRTQVLAVYPKLTADEKQDAVATLASRKEYALALLDAVERRRSRAATCPRSSPGSCYALGDAGVTERLRKVVGRGPRDGRREAEADREVQGACSRRRS